MPLSCLMDVISLGTICCGGLVTSGSRAKFVSRLGTGKAQADTDYFPSFAAALGVNLHDRCTGPSTGDQRYALCSGSTWRLSTQTLVSPAARVLSIAFWNSSRLMQRLISSYSFFDTFPPG